MVVYPSRLLLLPPLISSVFFQADECKASPKKLRVLEKCETNSIVQVDGKMNVILDRSLDQDLVDRWTQNKVIVWMNLTVVSLTINHLNFPKLTHLSFLTIQSNPNLESIDLSSLKEFYYILIRWNPALKSIKVNIGAIGQTIQIRGNLRLEQDSIEEISKVSVATRQIQVLGDCNHRVLASTSELDYCKAIESQERLEIEPGTEGAVPTGVDEILVGNVLVVNTNIETLSFVKLNRTRDDNSNEIHGNSKLCDEDLFEKFNVPIRGSGQHEIHSNCDEICDPYELNNPADADQLLTCPIYRDNTNLIGGKTLLELHEKTPKVTKIMGKVALIGNFLTNLSLLQRIEEIESREQLALEISGLQALESLTLNGLKRIESTGLVKLKITGNSKSMSQEEYEKLKQQTGLRGDEMLVDIVASADNEPVTGSETTESGTTGTETTGFTATTTSSFDENTESSPFPGNSSDNQTLESGGSADQTSSSSSTTITIVAISVLVVVIILGVTAGAGLYFYKKKKKRSQKKEKKTETKRDTLHELKPRAKKDRISTSRSQMECKSNVELVKGMRLEPSVQEESTDKRL